ncbi:MAG: glutaminyl-peptide cyclotransferase [Lentisphaerae bacterium]|nr:glutaminyl-peptide cyclotransferase [Lentisphaerota bacterium]
MLLAGGCGREGAAPRISGYRIAAAYPHDPAAFTQGLVWHAGRLYESTGLEGRSTLREVDLASGRVLRSAPLPSEAFGEGLASCAGRLLQLTWRSGIGYVWRPEDFALLGTFSYPGEGWGLTSDGNALIMSDGTDVLRFLDPLTFRETARRRVTDEGAPVTRLNELEYVRGEILANVWGSVRIARIDPATGNVLGWIDLRGLLTPEEQAAADVLNGIAYDDRQDRLFVTGKFWPRLFEIELVPRPKE